MIQADVKLDTLGYFCPMPIIMTLKKIKELTVGQVLEVVSDDEGIKRHAGLVRYDRSSDGRSRRRAGEGRHDL